MPYDFGNPGPDLVHGQNRGRVKPEWHPNPPLLITGSLTTIQI